MQFNGWMRVFEVASQLPTRKLCLDKRSQFDILSGIKQISFPNLKHLDLSRNYLQSGEILQYLAMWPGLQSLDVSFNHLTKAGFLKRVDCSKMVRVSVRQNKLNELSLEDLERSQLEKLRVLELESSQYLSDFPQGRYRVQGESMTFLLKLPAQHLSYVKSEYPRKKMALTKIKDVLRRKFPQIQLCLEQSHSARW